MEDDRVTDEIFVAVYENATFAEAAVADLKRAGVPEIGITLHSGTAAATGDAAPGKGSGFWASLFGGEPDHVASAHGDFAPGGSTVLTVKTPEALVGEVMEILESHEPIDLRERGTIQDAAQSGTHVPPVATMPVPGAATHPSSGGKAGATDQLRARKP